MSRVNWTEELVSTEVFRIMDAMCIDRMPTVSEMRRIDGDSRLSNKISKSGGFIHWADKLGLKSKQSDTGYGIKHEELVRDVLVSKGFEVEMMSTKHPYDLLVNGEIKVDVKASRFYAPNNCHTFNLYKDKATCDIYVAVAVSEDEVEDYFIIPSKFLKVTQLSIGKRSKYNRFIDRWEYFNVYNDFYEGLSN